MFSGCPPVLADDIAGYFFFGFLSPMERIAVGIEILEYISAENRVRDRAAVSENRGIGGPLPILAGEGCGATDKNHQCCNG